MAVNACVCGDHAEALVQPMRELGTPILDAWGVFPYAASACIFNDPTDPMPSCGQGALLRDLSDDALDRLFEAVGPLAEMPQVAIQIRHVGGAMARVAHDDTPIGCMREAEYLTYMVGVPNPFVSAAALHDHAEGVLTALGEAVLCRGPLNFIGEGTVRASAVRGVYGEAEYERLRRVKRAIDPSNAFCFAGVGLVD